MPSLPVIDNKSSRKLLSYVTQPQLPYTDEEVNPSNNGSITNFKQNLEKDATIKLTGNVMVDTKETNVINVSLDNRNNTQDVNLNILYNTVNDSGNAFINYTTTAEQGQIFFQQYPTKNRFVSVEAVGNNLTDSSNVLVEGSLRLAKYTQFNTSSQIRDGIDRNSLAINERSVNNYYEDIALGKIKDIQMTTQNSAMDYLPTSNGVHIVGNGNMRVPTFFTNYPLTDTKVVLVSDNAGDTNPISISGMSSNGSFHTEQLDLLGTSNSVSSIHNYRVVNPMLGSATGNVSCNALSTGELLNYIESESYISSQCLFASNIHQKTVIKNLKYIANIDYRGSLIKLVKYNVLGQSEVLHRHKIIDQQLDIELGIFNYVVTNNEIVVVLLEHKGKDSLTTNTISVKLDLIAHSDTLNFF